MCILLRILIGISLSEPHTSETAPLQTIATFTRARIFYHGSSTQLRKAISARANTGMFGMRLVFARDETWCEVACGATKKSMP